MKALQNTHALRAVLALPLIVLAVAGTMSMNLWCLALLFPAAALIFETTGKYPSLFLGAALWIWVGSAAASLFPSWGLFAGVFAVTLLVAGLGMPIGHDWGQRRYAVLAVKGRGIREWEWVYVGRSFAASHRLNRLSVGIWLVGLAVLSVPVLIWYTLTLRGIAPHPMWWLGVVSLYLLTLISLLRRWPVAYPLVHLTLAPGLPLSLPVYAYWADGVRPNLIYRHRFERLVPEENNNV